MHSPLVVGVIVLAVLTASGIAAWIYFSRRHRRLEQRFGPEYQRAVSEMGSRRRAEQALEEREKRVEKFALRPLSPADQDQFSNRWRGVQTHFVDDPKLSVVEADSLVTEIMQTCGYPMADFEQRAADISVDHPIVTQNYRAAHDIAVRQARGQASTEDLRRAMIHYRALFEDLTGQRSDTAVVERKPVATATRADFPPESVRVRRG